MPVYYSSDCCNTWNHNNTMVCISVLISYMVLHIIINIIFSLTQKENFFKMFLINYFQENVLCFLVNIIGYIIYMLFGLISISIGIYNLLT